VHTFVIIVISYICTSIHNCQRRIYISYNFHEFIISRLGKKKTLYLHNAAAYDVQ